jgi:hypothetical protein
MDPVKAIPVTLYSPMEYSCSGGLAEWSGGVEWRSGVKEWSRGVDE